VRVNAAAARPGPELTEDTLLGGRIRLRQPATGYRVAIDPIFLAAAVPASAHDTVVDLGCGVGAAALCLAARVNGCRVIGLDKQRDLVRLCGDNAALNGLADRVSAIAGDVNDPPPRLSPGAYAHVMANPPFLEAGAASPSPQAAKHAAHVEDEADLATWLRFALAMVRPKGSIVFIHRADRLDALIAGLVGKAGEITIFPLWPKAGVAAKRVIVRARKAVQSPCRLAPGMILHGAAGEYTAEADFVLRGGAPLEI
jgi:tRNA1(Val) A37 N6-methylase TrmN6